MEGMMKLSTDFFRRAIRDAAVLEARSSCTDGWATLSETDLAALIYEFCMRINDQLTKDNERLQNEILDYLNCQLPQPIIIPRES